MIGDLLSEEHVVSGNRRNTFQHVITTTTTTVRYKAIVVWAEFIFVCSSRKNIYCEFLDKSFTPFLNVIF